MLNFQVIKLKIFIVTVPSIIFSSTIGTALSSVASSPLRSSSTNTPISGGMVFVTDLMVSLVSSLSNVVTYAVVPKNFEKYSKLQYFQIYIHIILEHQEGCKV